MGKICCAVIDTLKAVEYVSIDSPKVNLSAASGLLLSEERNGSQLNTLSSVCSVVWGATPFAKKISLSFSLSLYIYMSCFYYNFIIIIQ